MKKSYIISSALLFMMLFNATIFAQDGEAIFKSKCSACHILGKDGTGPNLAGAKQKWVDAGEGDMLAEWVKNSTALIAGGKSKLANEIKAYSPMDMPAQDVTPADVDAIFTFIDTPVATPSIENTSPTNKPVTPEVTYIPNYNDNLTLFYWLLLAIAILAIGIIIMSSSIMNLAKSDYFKNKLAEKNAKEENNSSINTTLIAILGMFGLMAMNNSSLALSFNSPGEAVEKAPWLMVENSDIYFLIAINLILVAVIFYLKGMFKNLMNLIRSKEETVVADTPKAMKKINKVLTDVVPIEEEESILMHHEYDGIRELDNNLPPWWVWMFVITIIFAVVYLFNYHILKTGDLQYTAYEKEMKQADKEVKAYLEANAMDIDETSVTLSTDSGDLDKGKALFETNCVTCHNPKGEGIIGPNLTDKNWIYGYDIKDVFKTIKNGTSNGMPEHGSKFNPVQIQQVASFVLSLPETKGKEAQGDIIEK
ncbi:MAG: c-type cytochrome [Flavobacteriia bacterium]|nr:c-type cytochrome [Flavobacteriia bacterium]